MTTPLYMATVRLQIDRNVAKIVDSGNVLPVEGSDAEFFRTQQELLRSRAMAERVATSLDLGSDADFFKPRGFSLLGPPRAWCETCCRAARRAAEPAAARQGGVGKGRGRHRHGAIAR